MDTKLFKNGLKVTTYLLWHKLKWEQPLGWLWLSLWYSHSHGAISALACRKHSHSKWANLSAYRFTQWEFCADLNWHHRWSSFSYQSPNLFIVAFQDFGCKLYVFKKFLFSRLITQVSRTLCVCVCFFSLPP